MEPVFSSTDLRCTDCNAVCDPHHDSLVEAEGRIFHADHFRCRKCSKPFNESPYVYIDNLFQCQACYEASSEQNCGGCHEAITGEYVEALGKLWHPEHFVCHTCRKPFEGAHFRSIEDTPFCEQHFRERMAMKCARCDKVIMGKALTAVGKRFHHDCFVCDLGNHSIAAGIPFYIHENKILCHTHYEELIVRACHHCPKQVFLQ